MAQATEKKELALGYALWALSLIGICGVQRAYIGQPGLGLAMLITFGFCGVGQVLDLLLFPDALNRANQRLGFMGSDDALSLEGSQAIQPSQPQPRRAVGASTKSRHDAELERLLHQAEKSMNRTENLKQDN